MNLCDDGYQEVVFEARLCPMCLIIKEKDEEIEALRRELVDAQDQV